MKRNRFTIFALVLIFASLSFYFTTITKNEWNRGLPESKCSEEKVVYVDRIVEKHIINNVTQEEKIIIVQNQTRIDSFPSIALIIFAFNRPDYLKRTLEAVFRYIPENLPVIVCQDGTDEGVARTARSFPRVAHFQHIFRSKQKREIEGYYYLASNYKFGFETIFDRLKYESAIILEDDLDISPDFFDYMLALHPILQRDKSLFCISAWNDNGKPPLVEDPEALYRSDFFPGLGWMMRKDFWDEISPIWPKAYWDDWLRNKLRRKERGCIRPEISRTFTFGERGTSNGQFYYEFLAKIKLNDKKINWLERDLSYLEKEKYDSNLEDTIKTSKEVKDLEEIPKEKVSETFLIKYASRGFPYYAQRIGLMNDDKDGVWRTGYKGIVHVRYNSNLLLLVP